MAHRTRKRLRRPSRRILILAIALAVVVGGGSAFAYSRLHKTEVAQATTTTATAATTTMERTIAASGTLTPTSTADESFEASGTVQRVYVEEGDTVTEGQKLATIDNLSLTEARLSAKVTYLSAKADYDEAVADDDGSTLSDARISAAKAALKLAKESYREAKDAMSDQTLTASVAGLVTDVGIEVGDVVSSGSSSASGSDSSSGTGVGMAPTTTSTTTDSGSISIVGTDTWEVNTTVSSSDIENVAEGQQVEMTSDDLTDTVYGLVTSVGKLPDTSSGTIAYPVTVTVTGDTSSLYDGVSVDVTIIYERRTDVLTVPSAAVSTTDGTSTVELVGADGTTTTTTVETGQSSGNQTEITSGLSEGDTVQYEPFRGLGGSGNGGDSDQEFQMPDFSDFENSGGGQGGQGGPPSGMPSFSNFRGGQ